MTDNTQPPTATSIMYFLKVSFTQDDLDAYGITQDELEKIIIPVVEIDDLMNKLKEGSSADRQLTREWFAAYLTGMPCLDAFRLMAESASKHPDFVRAAQDHAAANTLNS